MQGWKVAGGNGGGRWEISGGEGGELGAMPVDRGDVARVVKEVILAAK